MDTAPWGGSEELWSQSALKLRKLGHEVFVSVYRWPQPPRQLQALREAGVSLSFRALKLSLAQRFLRALVRRLSPGPLSLTERLWLRRVKADVVVVSQGGPWDGIPWMQACRAADIRYAALVQANSELWWPDDDRLEAIRHAYISAAQVFFVSKANQALLQKQCGLRLPLAEVVSNPLKFNTREETSWPSEAGDVQIACAARLDPRAKGQDLLLEVLSLPKWRNRPLTLNVYGAGPCEKSIRGLVELFALEKVRFHGHLPGTEPIWAANHALVLPSRFEGLPIVILEAMLHSRMVITTDVAGNTEVVKDEVNGFVAGGTTVAMLDEAMERAWVRRAEWQKMGARARADASRSVPTDAAGEFVVKLLALGSQRAAVASEPRTEALQPAPTP